MACRSRDHARAPSYAGYTGYASYASYTSYTGYTGYAGYASYTGYARYTGYTSYASYARYAGYAVLTCTARSTTGLVPIRLWTATATFTNRSRHAMKFPASAVMRRRGQDAG